MRATWAVSLGSGPAISAWDAADRAACAVADVEAGEDAGVLAASAMGADADDASAVALVAADAFV
ncbi:MAG: hypothetical protein ABI343_16580, partial [Burkholderiaceae bacterium]